jgi:hypothetical protein
VNCSSKLFAGGVVGFEETDVPWYQKQFAEGRIGLSPQSSLEDFKEVFAAFAHRRPGAAAFFRLEADGSAIVYLTPASAEFAAMIQATAIEGEPSADALLLLHRPVQLLTPQADIQSTLRIKHSSSQEALNAIGEEE